MSLEAAGILAGIAALLWGVYTTRRGWSNDFALRRAEFIRGYTNDFYASPVLPALFLEIDNKRFKFGPEQLGTKAEVELAQLLDFFNTLGMTVDQGLVRLEDVRKTTVGYAALVTWLDPNVQWFLDHVDRSDSVAGLGTSAFGYFREVGQALAS